MEGADAFYHTNLQVYVIFPEFSAAMVTLFNTQNIMETRLATLYSFEDPEFENYIGIFSLALVFELQLWHEISLFSAKY